ncbi:hypothetical protein ABTY96_24155 [Streptomyces sp. NPDC096057]|uniref:collagen-like triple helix repeat-containing protein n=1 Tax=Streptomyces sp. NPDC096057 TaxID=3155543 RepID=UPI00332F2A40
MSDQAEEGPAPGPSEIPQPDPGTPGTTGPAGEAGGQEPIADRDVAPAADPPGLPAEQGRRRAAGKDSSPGTDGAPAPEQPVSFEESSAVREQHSLLKSNRGAVNLGPTGHAVYIESMYSGDGGPQKTKVQKVSFPEDVVTAIYVDVPGQAELEGCLEQHHVMVLYGEEGTGRRATATRILTQQSRPRYEISALYREDADVIQGVCDQAEDVLERKHGYLVEAGAWPVTANTLDRLAQLAVGADAYLVITGSQSSFPGTADDDRVFEHTRPDSLEVLEAHLKALVTRHRHHCRRDEEDGGPRCDADHVTRFLDRVTGDEQLRSTLGLARSVTGVVQLARVLAENIHAPDEDLGDVIGRWRDWLRLLAREMLGLDARRDDNGAPAPHHQAFRITYAFFNGHPLSDVVEAGDLLSQIMLPHFGIAEDDMVNHMAEQNIHRLVPQEMRASEAAAADTRNTFRRALLVHDELLHSMLENTWDAYGRLRIPLLDWLDLLVGGRGPGRERVRVRVAQLVGLLMGHDFDFVYQRRVGPWARSDSGVRRVCAALALEMAAAETGAADRVASRVQDWARSPGVALQDSAARAYGTSIGLRDVPATLTELGRLGRKPDQVVFSSIAFSTAWLFLAGRVEEVMAELDRWATARDEYLPRHAVRTMLALGRYTVSADRPGRPALAELALADDRHAELLVTLLNRALITGETSTRAWNLLARWLPAADAEDNEDLAKLYEFLAPRIFTGPLKGRARFHLNQVWLPRHKDSTTLRRVLAAI